MWVRCNMLSLVSESGVSKTEPRLRGWVQDSYAGGEKGDVRWGAGKGNGTWGQGLRRKVTEWRKGGREVRGRSEQKERMRSMFCFACEMILTLASAGFDSDLRLGHGPHACPNYVPRFLRASLSAARPATRVYAGVRRFLSALSSGVKTHQRSRHGCPPIILSPSPLLSSLLACTLACALLACPPLLFSQDTTTRSQTIPLLPFLPGLPPPSPKPPALAATAAASACASACASDRLPT